MTPERWRRVQEVFHGARQSPPAAREEWLRLACASDPGLRAEVDRLLAAHLAADGFLSDAHPDANAPTEPGAEEEETVDALVGRRLGAYELVRRLGRGGMGVVYLGERADDQFRQRVAVKVVRRGMDSDFVLRRFRAERQILAGLVHPNIARLYDGGVTEDGRPYFVMEFVEGSPILAYARDQGLDVRARVELFREVCGAVQFAHQNLVVHRDLKPANILVTPSGVPKLLDFGIAKMLDAQSAPAQETVTAVRMMTPEYASPEQVRGEPIATASDVYSLGVILYELLTTCRPYSPASPRPGDVARAVCEEEPEAPSERVTRPGAGAETETMPEGSRERLRRRLRGDLDNIVLTALRKEPGRRYASVERLSDDLRRHLVGLPVAARKDTMPYRAAKFARRHRAALAAAVLVSLSVAGGLVATVREARIARGERARAERRFNDVRKLANTFLFEFHDAIFALAGSTPARKLVVTRGLEYLDSLAAEQGNDPALQRELATAYHRIGDIQGRPGYANLGDTAGALRSYRKALALRQELIARRPDDLEVKADLGTSWARIADILGRMGNAAAALDMTRRALVLREEVVRAEPKSVPARHDLAGNYTMIGDWLMKKGDPQGALESFQRGLAVREGLMKDDPNALRAAFNLSIAWGRQGNALHDLGRVDEALSAHGRAIAIDEKIAREHPDDARARGFLAVDEKELGDIQEERGQLDLALASFRAELEGDERRVREDPADAGAHEDLAVAYGRVGGVLERLGRAEEAVALHRKALAIREARLAADPENQDLRADLGASLNRLCAALTEDRRPDAAWPYCTRAVGTAERLASPTYPAAQYLFLTSLAHLRDAARALLARAPGDAERRRDLCTAGRRLAEVWTALPASTRADPAALREIGGPPGPATGCTPPVADGRPR